jgi:hypothetical protein
LQAVWKLSSPSVVDQSPTRQLGDLRLQPADQAERTEDALSIAEEELHVEKRQVAMGRVTVRTTTEISEQVARATLEGGSVEVTRVPVNREIDAAPSIRTDGT